MRSLLDSPGSTANPPQSVLNDCKTVINQISALGTQNAQIPASELEADQRRWAQCMRWNGIPDWPDPNPDGTFSLPPSLSLTGAKTGAYRQQENACKKYVSASGIHFLVSS
jgi:hypothetical protein